MTKWKHRDTCLHAITIDIVGDVLEVHNLSWWSLVVEEKLPEALEV